MRQQFRMTGGLQVASTILTTLVRLGAPVGPSALLSVRGRTSGNVHTIPIAVLEYQGARYLVGAFGEVGWVRNLRAAGRARLTRGRRAEAIGAVELDAPEAAPVLKQYLKESRRVPFIKPYFHVTPESSLADFEREALYHPIFRIVSAPAGAPAGPLASIEENKALVRRFYQEGVRNPALLSELLAPSYVLRLSGSPPIAGVEQAQALMVAYTTAFPDLQVTTESIVAESDKVAIRNVWSGTHQGVFQGAPPTGKRVTFTGSDTFRLASGKIAEQWADLDALGLMRQLGVIPAAS